MVLGKPALSNPLSNVHRCFPLRSLTLHKCTCAQPFTNFSSGNTECVIMRCSCVSVPKPHAFFLLTHPPARHPFAHNSQFVLTRVKRQMGGSHSFATSEVLLGKFSSSAKQTDFKKKF